MPTIEDERRVYYTFREHATPLLSTPPANYGEWMVVMQHFGAPTRLLDWTTNPLIGLFFCVADPEERNSDGTLWVLEPHALNVAQLFFEQDSNPGNILLLGEGDLPSIYDLDRLAPETSRGPVAVVAPRIIERAVAQSGVFTLFDLEQTPLTEVKGGRHVRGYTVPAVNKAEILSQLTRLGVEPLTIFPGLESIGKHAGGVLP